MRSDDVDRLIEQRKAQALEALDEMVAENQRLGLYDDAPLKKEWVGLTREEINVLARWADEHAAPFYLEFAKAIEAKLKEKNP